MVAREQIWYNRIIVWQQPSASERHEAFNPSTCDNKKIQVSHSVLVLWLQLLLECSQKPAFGNGKLKVLKCHRKATFDSAPQCAGWQWMTKCRCQKCTEKKCMRESIGEYVCVHKLYPNPNTISACHHQLGLSAQALGEEVAENSLQIKNTKCVQ